MDTSEVDALDVDEVMELGESQPGWLKTIKELFWIPKFWKEYEPRKEPYEYEYVPYTLPMKDEEPDPYMNAFDVYRSMEPRNARHRPFVMMTYLDDE